MQGKFIFSASRLKAKINLIHIGRKDKAKGWNANLNLSSSFLMQKINGFVYYRLHQQKAKVNFILSKPPELNRGLTVSHCGFSRL